MFIFCVILSLFCLFVVAIYLVLRLSWRLVLMSLHPSVFGYLFGVCLLVDVSHSPPLVRLFICLVFVFLCCVCYVVVDASVFFVVDVRYLCSLFRSLFIFVVYIRFDARFIFV